MIATANLIDGYVSRLRERGEALDHIQRFYVFYDEDLMESEAELADSDQRDEFYSAVESVYRQWMQEMGEAKWREVEAFNDSQNGANQNWLIGDTLVWPSADHSH